MSKWDKGVDYDHAYELLARGLTKAIKRKDRVRVCYNAILLTQLRNGCRVSEAVRAFKEFLKTRASELKVEVAKKKKKELRLIIIPHEALDNTSTIVALCYDLLHLDDKTLTNRVKSWCRFEYEFNTHSLRYAFITHLLRMGVSSSIVAKITKHSRLDYILTYTQERQMIFCGKGLGVIPET